MKALVGFQGRMSQDFRDPRRWRRTTVGKFLHGLVPSAPPWQCPFKYAWQGENAIYIYKVALSVCLFVCNLSTARVTRRRTPRATENSFRRRSPVKVWNVGENFAFVFVGFPTRRQRTPMKPHTLSSFFFVGFSTAANKRAAGCIQSNDPVFNQPVYTIVHKSKCPCRALDARTCSQLGVSSGSRQ